MLRRQRVAPGARQRSISACRRVARAFVASSAAGSSPNSAMRQALTSDVSSGVSSPAGCVGFGQPELGDAQLGHFFRQRRVADAAAQRTARQRVIAQAVYRRCVGEAAAVEHDVQQLVRQVAVVPGHGHAYLAVAGAVGDVKRAHRRLVGQRMAELDRSVRPQLDDRVVQIGQRLRYLAPQYFHAEKVAGYEEQVTGRRCYDGRDGKMGTHDHRRGASRRQTLPIAYFILTR